MYIFHAKSTFRKVNLNMIIFFGMFYDWTFLLNMIFWGWLFGKMFFIITSHKLLQWIWNQACAKYILCFVHFHNLVTKNLFQYRHNYSFIYPCIASKIAQPVSTTICMVSYGRRIQQSHKGPKLPSHLACTYVDLCLGSWDSFSM